MLELLVCEFMKLKRKKLIPAIVALSVLFPLLVVYVTKSGMSGDMSAAYLQQRFDYSYSLMLSYGLVLLEPCLLGILASLLFFLERDNDTFKNIRVIPVTTTKLVLAKILVLLIYSLIYTLANVLFTVLFTWILGAGTVYELGFKIGLACLFSVGITVASLPVIVCIVYFNKTYLISMLLSFFYAILSWGMLAVVSMNLSLIRIINCFPILCVMNWTSGLLLRHSPQKNLAPEAYAMIPSNLEAFAVLGVTLAVSLFLIFRFYRRWTR